MLSNIATTAIVSLNHSSTGSFDFIQRFADIVSTNYLQEAKLSLGSPHVCNYQIAMKGASTATVNMKS